MAVGACNCMQCYRPLDAWQRPSGGILLFKNPRDGISRFLRIPCGQCVGCRLERSRQWAVRCMHESALHDSNSFVTLTYSEDFIPEDFSLRHSDFQKFMKRLRERYEGKRIRYYMCGEYGENYSRPHYHSCLFGVGFPDRYPWRKSAAGFQLYRSETLEKLWPFGQCEIGDVTFESAAYVARYVMKKITGDQADEHYKIVDPETGEIYWRLPEYTRMSLKPGIGADWYRKYKDEVFPLDRVVVRGVECKPPRYYDNLLAACDEESFGAIKEERRRKAVRLNEDNSIDRLRVKETVAKARLSKLKRAIE